MNAKIIESIALQIKDRTVKLLSIAADKLQIVTINARAVATRLQIALTGKATIAQKRLIIQQKALNAAMKMNPIGLVIAGITALIAAVKLYDQYNANSRRLEEEKLRAITDIQTATDLLTEKYDAIHESISKLNTLSVEEKNNLREKTKLTIEQAEAELLLLEAKQQEVLEDNAQPTAWQRSVNAVRFNQNPAAAAAKNVQQGMENGLKAADELNPELEKLREKINSKKTIQLN